MARAAGRSLTSPGTSPEAASGGCRSAPADRGVAAFITDGFEAVALQHEIDHIDGLLFLDRVSGPHGLHPRPSYL